MARALLLAMCALLARPALAAADAKTSKVTIETDPPGAKVYFGLKEDGEICTTPCTVDAPLGETAIIVEAENRRSVIDSLVVRKRNRPQKVIYKLELAVGSLVVEGGAGATIKLDDLDRGKAPLRIDNIQAGGHHVALEKNGKAIYDEIIEIEAGGEATVSAPAAVETPSAGDAAAVAATGQPSASGRRGARSVAVSAAVDVGYRHFNYSVPDASMRTPYEQDEQELGQVLVGPILEIWPTTLLGLKFLPGLALYGRFECGVNPQAVPIQRMDGSIKPTTLTTAWQSLEISLHHRWTVADAGTIEVGAGYVDDRYRFNASEAADLALVPDAAYKAVRIGGRASLLFGPLEPYIAIEQRIVLRGGALENRYKLGTSVYGVRGALGASARLGHFEARLEGALTLYSWTFKPDTTRDVTNANGGDDVIENVTFALGYVL
ncbi:MAG TPA: PEGA domain-containing protein [Kofleriaceae bacterium]|nr:PEGA domain-containing protein [Kofleriaceae bacterium]